MLPESARSPSGYRLYDCDDVDRLLALRALADVGVSLKDAAHSGRDTKDRLQVALDKAMVERAAIEVRISKLEAMLAHEHEFAAAPNCPSHHARALTRARCVAAMGWPP